MPPAIEQHRQQSKRPISGTSHANTAKLSEPASEATVSEESTKAPWRALFFFTTRSNLPVLISGIVFSIIAGASVPVGAWLQGKIFESFSLLGAGQLTAEQIYNQNRKYVLYFVALAVATWIVNTGEFASWMSFGELQAKNARDRLFHGLLKKEIEWYDMRKHGIGALLPRLQVQIRELQLATSQPLGGVFQQLSTFVLSLAQAFYFSWDLTLVTISSVPLVMGICVLLGRPMQKALTKQQGSLEEAQKYLTSAFSAIETVKCFNGQEIELGKYVKKVGEAALWYYRVANAHALQLGFLTFLASTIFVQGFFYGGVLINNQKKTAADVMTCFLSAIAAFQALQGIMPNLIVLEKGRSAGATLRMIMAEVQGGAGTEKPTNLLRPEYCKGEIDVRNVSFAYPARPDQLALDDVTMRIPAGDITYLIGKSGSGKSTLSQLLMRFYNSAYGSISVDGIPLESLDAGWLRSNFTLVEQTSLLFNDTVFKNIAFGRRDLENVTKADVTEAVEFALLQMMITDMPDGLDTIVGYKGGTMSGGQRQRMALARARLRDTPILMLDESTSALDHIRRALMMDAIRHWRRGKTTIIITHDISQIHADDYVFVLEQGKMVQEGFRKHMERLRDTPFQAFLPPELRATDSPYDARKNTTFESIYTRGSSIDYASITTRETSAIFDPLEAQLTATETKRASFVPQVFTNGGPVPGMRAAGTTGLTSAFASPFLRMAVNPPTLPALLTQWEPAVPGSRDSTPLTSPVSDRAPTKARMSVILENLVDRAGKQAANARAVPGNTGVRRRRPVQDDTSSVTTGPKSKHADKDDEASSPDDVRQQTFKEILKTVWPNLTWFDRCVMIAGFYCAAVHAAATPVFAWVFSMLITAYSVKENRLKKTLTYSMAMLGIAAVDGFHTYMFRYLLEYAGQRWVDKIREQAMIRILDQPREFFDKEINSVSRMTEGLDRNAEEMKNILGRFVGMIFAAALMSTIAIVWSIAGQWKFALTCLAAAPYVYLVTNAFAVVSGRWETICTDASESASSIMNETFINIRTVMALTLEDYFLQKFTVATDYALKVGFIRAFLSGFFYGLSDSAGVFVTALIFYVGTLYAKDRGPEAVPGLLHVCSTLVLTINNVSALLSYVPQIGQAKDTASRLLRLAQLPKDSHEHLGDTKVNTIGDIVFNNLNFSYPSRPDAITLRNINLCIKPGTSTAIVGGSGSGKSTIANLLLNLDTSQPQNTPDPNTLGDLTLAGRDIKNVDTASLRALIVVVPQTPVIFAATATENIAYGLPTDSPLNNPDQIAEAACAAGIHAFIKSLPSGYATLIGDGGLGLSGGQAQRIAIARALVRKPSVLILDEATSALDVESANLVRDTLKALLEESGREMTVIIITHSREQMQIA